MTINFNTDPYYDDFDETKDFYRILFRPGVAVQARELTQIQTILQKQVNRIGDHLFKNGSQIIPGSVNVDNQVDFAKLNTTYNSVEVTSYLTNFKNLIITGATSGVTAVVIDSSECACVIDGTIPTLYFKYESTAADGETKRFLPGEDLCAYAADNTTENNYRLTSDLAEDLKVTISAPVGNTTYTNNESTDVIGKAFQVEVKEGIYYIDGIFVRNDELHLYIGRFSNNPTARVGFKVVETVVTPEDDNTLLDPAQGTYNYTAPGAHRFKIDLELTELPEESSGSDNIKFIELIRIKNGQVQSKVSKTSYAELEKAMARRTYDANGHFEVNKFKLTKREHLDDGTNNGVYAAPDGDETKFVMAIDPGRAYVYGYEVEAITTTFVDFDKARGEDHTVELEGQPIGTPVGNYILIDNLKDGYPNFENFEQVTLVRKYTATDQASHFAPSTFYHADEKVGTARVKSLELHSGSYSGNPQFKLGLFDIQMKPGYSFTNDVHGIRDENAVLGNTCWGANIIPSTDEGFVTGTATNDANQTGNGTTTITGTGTLFTSEFAYGDVVLIDGQIAGQVQQVNSNTDMDVYQTTDTTTVLQGRIQKARTVLQDSEYPNLIYPVGYQYIKSLYNIDGTRGSTLNIRRILTDTTDGSGTWSFTLSTQGETFLSDQDLENYTLFDSNGDIVNIDAGDISFDSNSNRKTVFISGLSNNTAYTLATTIRQTGVVGAEKTKTLQEDFSEDIVGKKIVTGQRITLSKADVFQIKDIRVTPGDYSTYTAANSISILDSFVLDDGQRPTHYQAGELVLKATKKVPSGALRVTYDYFTHSVAGNYFTVDSYTRPDNPAVGIDYGLIKTTNLDNGESVNLADVIDFRPIISGDNTTSPQLPSIGSDLNTDLAYYMARIDKLLLTSKGEWKVIKGVPSIDPQEPSDTDAGMIIASVFVPPYTKQVGDVKYRQRDNRRYTFKDLGNMDRRMTSMEEYVALDQLEKLTADLQITDSETGIDRFKNGFITDQFTGHSLGDVKRDDYRFAVDGQNKLGRPMHFTSSLDIIENVADEGERAAAGYQKTGDSITLPYVEESLIFNPYASRTIDVNPYKIGAFKGEVTLNPEGDNWKETDRRPDLTVTDNNGYDAIKFLADELGVTGTQWNEWETNWTGSSSSTRNWQTGDPNRRRQWVTGYEETVTTLTGTQSRTGIQTNLSTSVNSQDYGDRVVDLSYIPYMRSRPLVFTAKNLKPDTKFFPFFDDKSVAEYVTPAQVFKVSLSAGASYMEFDPTQIQQGVIADQFERTQNGKVEPAYSIGDVVTNSGHTATGITGITNLTSAAASFTLDVDDTTGISPGHHVILYNLAANRQIEASLANDNIAIPESTITDYTKNTSEELNLKKFKVSAINGNTITLSNIDGSNIEAFSTYDLTAYTGDTGKLLRLTASGVVAFQGLLEDTVTGGTGAIPVTNNTVDRDIHIVNIKNGFAVGDTITGSITTAGGQVNSVDIDSINGSTSLTAAPSIKTSSDDVRTDSWGSAVGVFNIPSSDALSFRTGERRFKLTDSRTNNDEDFDSKGSAVYYSTGISLSKEATVVNSRDVRFVEDRLYESLPVRRTSTSQRTLYSYWTGHDPVAQTFTVNSDGGASVTSIDLFFSEAGNRPITVELRTTNQGIPSTKIIPFSAVTKTPQEVSTSSDGSVPTTFTFDSPIYLMEGETYAVIVKTDEPGCRFFISELGEVDLVTGNVITSQPLTGSLYLSQNSLEFEINPLYDMKFNLRKALYSTTPVDVELKVGLPEALTLQNNPFTMSSGTNKVRVAAHNHGFRANDIVVISNVDDGVYGADATNGIPSALINGQHNVIADGLDKDSFIIEIQTTDTNGESLIVGTLDDLVRGEYGGSGVLCTRQLNMDMLYLKSGSVSVKGTNIDWYVNHESFGNNVYRPIVGDANYMFDNRETIKSYENQTIIQASPLVKRSSLLIKASLSTDNPNVSPQLDLQKGAAYVVSNLINSASESLVNVPELDATDLYTPSLESVTVTDTIGSGVGTASVSIGNTSMTLSASGDDITWMADAGDFVLNNSGTYVGEVEEVNNALSVTLRSGAAVALSSAAFQIQNNNHVKFYDLGTKGIIETSFDTADNLLGNASIGKYITINNISSIVNGTHQIEDILIESAEPGRPGNIDGDRITITLSAPFNSNSVMRLNIVEDTFSFYGSGLITTNGSTTVTGSSGSNFIDEFSIGDTLISSDGTLVGTVASISSATSLELDSSSAITVTNEKYTVRTNLDPSGDYSIQQLDKFVEDYAPAGTYNYANYITRPLYLNEPADSIKIIFDAEVLPSTDIDVYYRTAIGTEDIHAKIFTDTGFINNVVNPEGEFTKREIDITDIDPYTRVVIKIVMKSTNPVYVPKIKNLRLIAYS
jgi:hypothetical protein